MPKSNGVPRDRNAVVLPTADGGAEGGLRLVLDIGVIDADNHAPQPDCSNATQPIYTYLARGIGTSLHGRGIDHEVSFRAPAIPDARVVNSRRAVSGGASEASHGRPIRRSTRLRRWRETCPPRTKR